MEVSLAAEPAGYPGQVSLDSNIALASLTQAHVRLIPLRTSGVYDAGKS